MAEHATDESTGLLERWRWTEPLRLWLYGIAVPLLGLLVAYGLLTDHYLALWLAVAQAALLGGGTELARQFVVSPATAADAVHAAAYQVDETGRPVAAAREALIHYRIPR